MTEVFICDAVRTPFGRYGGALSSIRTDDLATLPIKALMERNASVEWAVLDDVIGAQEHSMCVDVERGELGARPAAVPLDRNLDRHAFCSSHDVPSPLSSAGGDET